MSTLCSPMDCSLLGSSVHGFSQAKILEWVVISYSRESFPPRNRTHLCITLGEGNGTPFQYSHLENPMSGGACRLQSTGSLRVGHEWATSLSLFLSCIGEGNGNPLQCSCLENPRDGGAWWAAIYGAAQSWTRLKWLSSCITFTYPSRSHPLWYFEKDSGHAFSVFLQKLTPTFSTGLCHISFKATKGLLPYTREDKASYKCQCLPSPGSLRGSAPEGEPAFISKATK